jgi:nucleoside-diphosphate-sugar epimerase
MQDKHPNALVGHSGFVGSLLTRQARFDACFRSANIGQIEGRRFGTIVCAGAPAQKWLANRDPAADRANIQRLMCSLSRVRCDRFVLISTVDVFRDPLGVDEYTPVAEDGLQGYGLHRLILEKFVASQFPQYLVVRLPGLVGPGLRKNVIFDFLNDNNLHAIDSRSVFQFYPMVNLWQDLHLAMQAGLNLVHLTAQPISVAEVASGGFNRSFDEMLPQEPASYDMRSRHAAVFGGIGPYQYSRRESLQAIRAYAQSEPRSMPAKEAA